MKNTNPKSNKRVLSTVIICSLLAMGIGVFWLFFGNTSETIALSSIAITSGLKLLNFRGIIKLKDKRSKWLTWALIAFTAYAIFKIIMPLFI
jgi:hypothetical protein